MTNSPATSLATSPTERRVPRTPALYIACVAIAAVASAIAVGWNELRVGRGDINWVLFVVLAAMLMFTETRPGSVMAFGNDGMVTPSWAFAFGLLLLGAPTAAIGVMATATALADLIPRSPVVKLIFNTGQVTLSLALGSLTMTAFGVTEPFFADGTIPVREGIAMVVSGMVVFFSNGIITGRLLSLLEGEPFRRVMRQGLMLSMSADGAMLALAPVLVISLQASLVMIPLFATTAALVFQTARQALQRAHEADHDPLTQLRNRRSFAQELDDHLMAGGGEPAPAAVFILDLDRFKEINDRLGHRTGDTVLQRFSERLTEVLPDRAVVARLGGDEFGVLLPATDAAASKRAAASIIEAFQDPLTVDNFPLSVSTSVGVALAPDHGSEPGELMHAADIAMYRAKRYRSGVECYEAFDTSPERGRVTLLADITEGFERDEFHIVYQPQVNMATGRIETVEALLRWNHPRFGSVSPSEFVALAEQTDLIEPLTQFALRRAIVDVGQFTDGPRLAVNVSARNLQSRHFADSVLELVDELGFDPGRLELEITESAVANEPERSAVTLEQLRSNGISIAIDDFGTGYTSFGMLRDICVDRIKIDRSFTGAIHSSKRDENIVASIIEMAHRLGLSVVAEGVERAACWEVLADHGCDVAQGYLIAEPTEIDLLAARLGDSWAHLNDRSDADREAVEPAQISMEVTA